jgi:hypothetical protein
MQQALPATLFVVFNFKPDHRPSGALCLWGSDQGHQRWGLAKPCRSLMVPCAGLYGGPIWPCQDTISRKEGLGTATLPRLVGQYAIYVETQLKY